MSLEYKKRAVDEGHKEWREQFMLLGKNLGIKVE
jgi:hypothetical protein